MYVHARSLLFRLGAGIVLGLCLSAPAHAVECGNGIVEAGESCDDGNRAPGDCCSPECVVEEVRGRCQACDDGVDNDGDGRVDAEDSGCATLSEYQRAAVAVWKPLAVEPAVSSVLLPGALVGEAIDASCSAGACACPDSAPECQTAGYPCRSDGDCVAIPYPLGRSRAGVCAGDAEGDAATDCRSQSELVVKARAMARMPGTAIDAIHVASGEAPFALSFAGGKQVIDVESIELESEAQLVLAGEVDTVLVLRVHGGLDLGVSSAVVLTGGLEADRVLWVFAGRGGRIVLGDTSKIAGTILAPERDAVEMGRGVRIYGAILASEVTESSGAAMPEALESHRELRGYTPGS